MGEECRRESVRVCVYAGTPDNQNYTFLHAGGVFRCRLRFFAHGAHRRPEEGARSRPLLCLVLIVRGVCLHAYTHALSVTIFPRPPRLYIYPHVFIVTFCYDEQVCARERPLRRQRLLTACLRDRDLVFVQALRRAGGA